MTREIVFDTETTGFEYAKGERLVEIGAVELINHMPTGVTYHQYINPEKEVPEEAFKVHGLSYDFLKDYPTFDKVADEWLDFIGDAVLVAHNASFDINFVNYELKQLGKSEITWDRVVDTLEIARLLFPGARCNLDALCKRFDIDNSNRTLHGALLDAQLLAEVYLELLGGREPSLLLDAKKNKKTAGEAVEISFNGKAFREARSFPLSEEELKNILDLTPGSVSPFGILNDKEHIVNVFLDSDFCRRVGFRYIINNKLVLRIGGLHLIAFRIIRAGLLSLRRIQRNRI